MDIIQIYTDLVTTAIFGLLSRKAQTMLEPLEGVDASSFDREQALKCLDILNKDCSGSIVAVLAEKTVNTYGSTGMKSVNKALDRWRLVWEQRSFRESATDGSSFSSDPLPFWFLSKLYLLVYLIRPPPESDFSLLMTHTRMSMTEKIRAQEKIVNWLNGFRVVQENTPSATTARGSTSHDGRPALEDETRIHHLMKPLQDRI